MITRNSDIKVLNLSNRARNLLRRSNINTVGELMDKEDAELKDIYGMGASSHCEIRKVLDELNVVSEDRWISVKDHRPKKSGMYWVFAPEYKKGSRRGKENHNGMMFSHYNANLQLFGVEMHTYNLGCVTHWMTLPEPPKEAER